MEITQQADYAVRAILELALNDGKERITSSDIAARQNIPQPFLSKILARLAAEGLVITQRGVYGGIRLARPAGEVNLLEVIESIDGPITINRSVERRPGHTSGEQLVYPVWQDLRGEVRRRLQEVTFAYLALQAQGLALREALPAQPGRELSLAGD